MLFVIKKEYFTVKARYYKQSTKLFTRVFNEALRIKTPHEHLKQYENANKHVVVSFIHCHSSNYKHKVDIFNDKLLGIEK